MKNFVPRVSADVIRDLRGLFQSILYMSPTYTFR